MGRVLVVNAGSSSLKFQIFEQAASSEPTRLIKGQMDGIGARPRLYACSHDGTPLVEESYPPRQMPDVATAIARVGEWLRAAHALTPIAVGHRVVHGGPEYDRPVLVDATVLARLEQYEQLAPLHQPNNLAPIKSLFVTHPDLAQVACFDTAFHRTHSAVADRYAIPEHFYADGVRRYGFHGLSYEYVAGRLRELAPEIAKGRVIVAHLGSGASMCALAGGKSAESTMGFTALDGLPMGTRSGQIDPGVLLYLMKEKGMSAAALEKLLYRDSGLKGISGISSDMRELEASDASTAALAIEYFVYRVALYTGMLTAALGGLDAFVFTAGIGQNSSAIRAQVAAKIAWLGVVFDQAANVEGKTIISRPESKIALYVVPTDEEQIIATHTYSLLSRLKRGQQNAQTYA